MQHSCKKWASGSQAIYSPHSEDNPTPTTCQTLKHASRPCVMWASSSCCNSLDINLPTTSALPTLELQPSLSSSREAPSIEPCHKSTTVCSPAVVQQVSTASIKTSQVTPAKVTPIMSINMPVLCCPEVVNPHSTTHTQPPRDTPGQVTPVTSVNAPNFHLFKKQKLYFC